MSAYDDIKQEITDLREGGFSDAEIAEYYHQEMTAGGIPANEINAFLKDFNINPAAKPAPSTPAAAPAPAATKPKLSLGKRIAEAGLDALPVAGATVGAVIGLPGLALGPWGAVAPVAGAGAGGVAGKSVENMIRSATGMDAPTPGEALVEPFKSGLDMAEMEAGFGVLGKGIGDTFKYFNDKRMAKNPMGEKALDYAKEHGLRLSPSTINPDSKWAKLKEAVVNLFPTGKAMTKYFQNKTYRWMMDSRGKFLEEVTGVPVGEGSFLRRAGDASTEAKAAGSQAYKDIITTAGGPKEVIRMDNIGKWFDEVYDSAPQKLKELINDFRTRTAKTGGKIIDRKLIDASMPDVWKQQKASFIANNPNVRPDPETAFYKMMEQEGAIKGWLPKGEPAAYTMTAKDLDEFLSKISKKGKEFHTQIYQFLGDDLRIFDKDTGKKVGDAVTIAQQKFKQGANYEFMNNLFTKFTSERSGEEFFQAGNFYRTVMNPKTQKYIKENFGDAVLSNLKDYAEMMVMMGREVEKRSAGSEGVRTAMTLALGGSLFQPTVAIPYGLAPAAAWFIMKPRKEFLKWIAGSQPAKEALKVGGRAAISQRNTRRVGGSW